jgi:apolipoprotein N-acyltransferase
MPLFWIIFLGLGGLGFYWLATGLWAAGGVLITLLTIIPMAIHDLVKWVKDAPKRRQAVLRKEAFKERVDEAIRWHNEHFPEDRDLDENGIPYL